MLLRSTALLSCLLIAIAGFDPAAGAEPVTPSATAVTSSAPALAPRAPGATPRARPQPNATAQPNGSAQAGRPVPATGPPRVKRPTSTRNASTSLAAGTVLPGGYRALTPARLLDTRTGLGAPKAALASHTTLTLQVAGRGGVPATGVSAVVLNVTVVSPSRDGYLTAYSTGTARPGSSNLNFHPGDNTANLTMTRLGTGGRISYYNGSSGTIQLLVDIAGYYRSGTATTPGSFTPLTPARLLDTRTGLGAPKAAVAGGRTVSLQVTGRGGVPATGVSAVVLNVTVVSPSRGGYLTAYSTGTARPGSSNVIFSAGVSVANLTVTRLGAGGRIDLYNGSTGTIELVADVAGYYRAGTPASPGAFTALPGQRLLDTRTGLGGGKAALAGNATLHLQVTGRAGVPATGVSAVVLTVSAVAPVTGGYLTSYPGGTAQPRSSNLNFAAGRNAAALVLVRVGAAGDVWIRNGSTGAVQVVADISGYFLDEPTSASTGAITGRVTETGGKPLANVLVSASDSSYNQVQVLTDPAGHYFLPALHEDSWSVCYQADATGLPRTAGGSSATGYLQFCQSEYVPVTAGLVSTGIDAQLGHGGAITGRVTDAAGHPLAGIVVQNAFGENGVWDSGVRTAADGSYRLAGLSQDSWKVCFDATGYTGPAPGGLLHQCYLNTDVTYGQPYSQAGTPVAVTVDHTTTAVNGKLHPGAAVSGRVTDPAGHPVPGIVVDAYPDSPLFTSTTSRADGSYQFSALPPGAYSICFFPSFSSGAPDSARSYVRQCYQQEYPIGAPNLALTAGHLLSNIDAHLNHGGSLQVTVTDPAGHPLGGVAVAMDGSPGNGVSAVTSDDGIARVDGLEAGKHRVCFGAGQATGGSSAVGYLDDCYLHQSDYADATLVSITTGGTTSIAEQLPEAGGVRLTVTDAAGHPVQGIAADVTPVGSDSGVRPAARTDADGHLILGRLAAGDYRICLDASGTDGNGAGVSGGDSNGGYRDRCTSEGEDPPVVVSVQLGQATARTMTLNAMGAIAGTVTDQRGHPLRYVAVTITRRDGFYQPNYLVTDADGRFSLTRQEDALFTVCFDASPAYQPPVSGGDSSTGYTNECFDNSTPDAPTELQVSAGTLSRADASLGDAAAIVGTLTDRTGNPVPGVQVSVAKDGFAVGSTSSDADGHYRINSLPPGSGLTVCVYPYWDNPSPNGLGYARQCYLDAADEAGATPIAVTAGQARTIDFTLEQLASLGGTVTDTHGNPVSDEQVTVSGPGGTSFLLYTGPDGTWRQDGIPAGNYRLCYQSYYGTGPSPTGYAPGCYDGLTPDATPTPIAVAAGERHTVDLSLNTPSALAGRVTDPEGHPAFVPVELFHDGTLLATVTSDSGSGAYEFSGLAAGSYTVLFDGTYYGYQSRYYHDVLPDGTPTPVPVPAETRVGGIDQALPPTG